MPLAIVPPSPRNSVVAVVAANILVISARPKMLCAIGAGKQGTIVLSRNVSTIQTAEHTSQTPHLAEQQDTADSNELEVAFMGTIVGDAQQNFWTAKVQLGAFKLDTGQR